MQLYDKNGTKASPVCGPRCTLGTNNVPTRFGWGWLVATITIPDYEQNGDVLLRLKVLDPFVWCKNSGILTIRIRQQGTAINNYDLQWEAKTLDGLSPSCYKLYKESDRVCKLYLESPVQWQRCHFEIIDCIGREGNNIVRSGNISIRQIFKLNCISFQFG